MAGMKFNKNFNINRVVKRLVYTILALYVGGTIISTFGTVMKGTSSPFYTGLSLIGWTIGSNATCANPCILTTSGTGVLAVVGIIGIAGVVMEFVRW